MIYSKNVRRAWRPAVQSVAASQADSAMANAANELIKFITAGDTTGMTLQAAFDAAIGATNLTGATTDGSYFFAMYNATSSRMDIGIVTSSATSDDVIEAGDVVTLVAPVTMTAADYANINATRFSIF